MRINFIICLAIVTVKLAAQEINFERNWATYFGGRNTTLLDSDLDSQGNIYIAGFVEGSVPYSNQFMTAGAFQPVYGGGAQDAFLAKFDANGLLLWATFFGGEGVDLASGVHVDKQDEVYLTGETASTGLATVGAHQTSLQGTSDGFIAKFTPAGIRIWSTYFGAQGTEAIHSLETDDTGKIYLYGRSTSTQGLTTAGSFQQQWTNPATGNDGNDFLAGFTANGSLLWCTYYGTNHPSQSSRLTGITVGTDFLYAAGFAIDGLASGFFATPGCHQSTNSNPQGLGSDMFLSKFSLNGDRLWSTYYGGSVVDRSVGSGGNGDRNLHTVAQDANSVYLTGLTNSPNNIATIGAYQTAKQGYSNFVARFNHDGVRQWGTYLGNTVPGASIGVFIANTAMLSTSANGEVYISGSTNMADIATPGSHQDQVNVPDPSNGIRNNDTYVAKLSGNGTTRIWGTYYGGSEGERAARALEHQDGFYMTGSSYSAQGIATNQAHQTTLHTFEGLSSSNAFIAKFSEIPLASQSFQRDDFAVYPNPSTGTFRIKLNANYIGATATIYDLTGKKLLAQKVENQTIDMQISAPSGTYLLVIRKGQNLAHSRKILIVE